jgi:HD-GYP domain-containing protein (c-di-GMP phosphodiesterase class II)
VVCGRAGGSGPRWALLHDLGRVAVSNRIWEQPATLSTTDWELVRLHPYQSERILARSRVLAPLARTAGMHHERQDGSGYHRGTAGAQVPAAARVLAAADAFQP